MYKDYFYLKDKNIQRYFIFESIIVIIEVILILLFMRYHAITQEEIEHIENKNVTYSQVIKKLNEELKYTENVITNLQEDINVILYMYNSNNITYENNNLRRLAYVTASEFNEILKGTNIEGLGDTLVQSELKYNINSIFLLALVIHESGWGTNKLSIEKNNITSYCAYDQSPFKSAKTFNSKAECIDTTARHLSNSYLNPNGKYFKGYGIKDINVFYANDKKWYIKINNITEKIIKKLEQNNKWKF